MCLVDIKATISNILNREFLTSVYGIKIYNYYIPI